MRPKQSACVSRFYWRSVAVAGFECSRLGFAAKVSELIGRDFRTLDPHNKSEPHHGAFSVQQHRPKLGARTAAPCSNSMCQGQGFDIADAGLVAELPGGLNKSEAGLRRSLHSDRRNLLPTCWRPDAD